MMFLQAYRSRSTKRKERAARIEAVWQKLVPLKDTSDILSAPVSQLVVDIRAGKWTPSEVLRAYSSKALEAHAKTNCISEVVIPEAEERAKALEARRSEDENVASLPLFGVPVSLKDSVSITGFDSCIGYSSWVGKLARLDSALIRLLYDAGALPFVKTTVPTTLLSFEASSFLLGQTSNPHNTAFSPGGSTGGEGALLAYGGSRLGIGTDVAGSVRVPAHWCGIYTIRASSGRFLRSGNSTSMPGQEGVPAVYSPMTRTLADLEYFWEAIMSMQPWKYDHSVLCLPWRKVTLPKKLKFGVMWDDGVVSPSPACQRALQTVIRALRNQGHEVVDFHGVDPYEGLQIASALLLADGGKTCTAPILLGESNDPGMREAMRWFKLPSLFKRLYIFYIRYIKRDPIYAGLLEGFCEKSIQEYYTYVARREDYRSRWFKDWTDRGVDFLLTVPNALPAVRHGGMKSGFKVCGYTFLFNLLDYPAGVIPVTKVDGVEDCLNDDQLSQRKKRNLISKGAYDMYDSVAMHGLPVGVQIIGPRLEEEKVLEGMKVIERALEVDGLAYVSGL